MADKEFTITELRRVDSGFVDTPVKFVWTSENRSAPRPSWRFGLEQRTIREDYPGSTQPVEQVLGWNYKQFAVAGTWDDRYNYAGFALETYRAFEEMVKRGNLVRLEFETVTIHGIILNTDFDYKRSDFISYQFEFSPHFRLSGDSSLPSNVKQATIVTSLKAPSEYRDRAAATMDAIESVHSEAPSFKLKPTLLSTVTGFLDLMRNEINKVVTSIDQRLDPRVEEYEALKRLANSFAVIKTYSANLLTELASKKSSTQLAWDSASGIMDFDVWIKSMAAYCRTLALTCHEANIDLTAKVEPKAIALYRPHKGESLYAISTRFYGTPTNWRSISERNGLTYLTLKGTETLIIPEKR